MYNPLLEGKDLEHGSHTKAWGFAMQRGRSGRHDQRLGDPSRVPSFWKGVSLKEQSRGLFSKLYPSLPIGALADKESPFSERGTFLWPPAFWENTPAAKCSPATQRDPSIGVFICANEMPNSFWDVLYCPGKEFEPVELHLCLRIQNLKESRKFTNREQVGF